MLENIDFTSKRLKTRNLNENDIEKLYIIYSDKESMKYRGSEPMKNIEDASKMVSTQKIEEKNAIKIRKAIVEKESNDLIGTLLLEWSNSDPNRYEVGFSFDKNKWNNGYGKETLDMVLGKLEKIKEIREIKAWCLKVNIASVKIFEKNGFAKMSQNEYPESYLFIKELRKSAENKKHC